MKVPAVQLFTLWYYFIDYHTPLDSADLDQAARYLRDAGCDPETDPTGARGSTRICDRDQWIKGKLH